jgi:hypothetical protein
VLNSLGQTIWTVQDAQVSNNLINIDLGKVKSGLYFVVIFDGKAEEVFKITVNKKIIRVLDSGKSGTLIFIIKIVLN